MHSIKKYEEFARLIESDYYDPIYDYKKETFEEKYSISNLHQAVYDNDVEYVMFLIQSGSNVNSKNKFGYTSLHWAVESGNFGIIELLVSSGADISVENIWGITPIQRAESKLDKTIYEFLIQFA
jgi:ankyrin repeat protein